MAVEHPEILHHLESENQSRLIQLRRLIIRQPDAHVKQIFRSVYVLMLYDYRRLRMMPELLRKLRTLSTTQFSALVDAIDEESS